MSRSFFKVFCIEHYSHRIRRPSTDVYRMFEREGVLQILEEDHQDLHGMGMEYLMQFIDEYGEHL